MNLIYTISIALILISYGVDGDANNYMSPMRKMRQKEILSRAGQNEHDIESLLNILEIYKKRVQNADPEDTVLETSGHEKNGELKLLSMKFPPRQKDMAAESMFMSMTPSFARFNRPPIQEIQPEFSRPTLIETREQSNVVDSNEPMQFFKDLVSNPHAQTSVNIVLPANSQPIPFSQSLFKSSTPVEQQFTSSKPVQTQPSQSVAFNQFVAAQSVPVQQQQQPTETLPAIFPSSQPELAQAFIQSQSSLPKPIQSTPTQIQPDQQSTVQSTMAQPIQFNQPMQTAHSNQQSVLFAQPQIDGVKFNQQTQPTLQTMQPVETIVQAIQPTQQFMQGQPLVQPIQQVLPAPVQAIQPSAFIQQPMRQMETVKDATATTNAVASAPQVAAASAASTSPMRPVQQRTIGMGDNNQQTAKSSPPSPTAVETPKTLSLTGVGGLMHHQQFYEPSVALSMATPMGAGLMSAAGMAPFDQNAFMMNQFMMPGQVQSLGMAPHAPHAPNAYQSSGPNYFQSNSFSNNPLRKNNDLNKARKELLSDPKFLKENAKLSHFLFTKYLKEAATPDSQEEIEKAPTKPAAKLRRIDKKKLREYESRKNKKDPEQEKRFDDEDIIKEELEEEEEKIKPKETVKEEKPELAKSTKTTSSNEEKPEKEVEKKVPKATSKASIKTLASKFAAKENKSKNVALVDLDDLESYLNNMKHEMDNQHIEQHV